MLLTVSVNGRTFFADKVLSWSPRYKRQLKRTAEHGATRPPCNTAARLLRGAGLSIGFFFQAAFSAFLFISAKIFTFATHFFEFVVADGTCN
ncbi:hypothetical protein Y032_0633g892 [Ancylostoma ceylanicum]|uniref:Uncharacterized protein n=1 Tax=Ancylostoma ceylanicum TaxID=53326 RepID=A0A016WJL8_9BILA|nr:hypothetical protein Y032_0633g892 [Ancylostoma ceylanicum]